MAKNDNVKAVVAPRRSVDVDGKLFGPGATVTLPLGEALDLLKQGFLVDPDADKAAVEAEGASIDTGAGAGDASITPDA